MIALPQNIWLVFLLYYLITITLETPVLLVGLSRQHSLGIRLFCGVWLTACTYPIVFFAIPQFLDPHHQRWAYLIVAETFAPIAECLLFWVFARSMRPVRSVTIRDYAAVVLANLTSFGIGEILNLWLV